MVQAEDPEFGGGANVLSLRQSRENYRTIGASDPRFVDRVRPPLAEERSTWHPFEYREFHDVPRLVVIRIGDRRIALASRFDDSLDEYSDAYVVSELRDDVDLVGDWGMIFEGARVIGRVDVADVRFDATRREEIDLASAGLARLII